MKIDFVYLGLKIIPSICLQWEQLMEMGAKEPDTQLENTLKSIAVNECCTLVYTVSYDYRSAAAKWTISTFVGHSRRC